MCEAVELKTKEGQTMTGLQLHACHYQLQPICEPVT